MNFVPITIEMERKPNESFGCTLRHMVENPENPDEIAAMNHASETLCVLEVQQNSIAQFAGLLPQDKVLMVNDLLVSNSPFNAIQNEIRNSTKLTLKIAPRDTDTLQMKYDILANNDQLIKGQFSHG